MQSGTIIKMYDIEQVAVGHTSDCLFHCFPLAYSARCYQGQLFDDLGFMGDKDCSCQILDGMYEYPPNTNVWTKKILQEAQHTFSQMFRAEITTMIMTKDVQDFWQCVDERTSSSFGGNKFCITRRLCHIQCFLLCKLLI